MERLIALESGTLVLSDVGELWDTPVRFNDDMKMVSLQTMHNNVFIINQIKLSVTKRFMRYQ